jgi:hypothetical protein
MNSTSIPPRSAKTGEAPLAENLTQTAKFFVANAPIFFGILFLIAGILKLAHPAPATMGLESLEIPYQMSKWTVIGLTVIELYLGVLLVFKIDLRYSISFSMALMFGFLLYLWYLTTLAHPPSCGCLGLTGIFQSTKSEAVFGVLRNCLLLWGLHWTYQNCLPTSDSAFRISAANSVVVE